MELLVQIMEVVVIPLLGILTTYIVKLVNTKINEISDKHDNEHCQRANDIEAGNHQYECQEDVRNHLFNLHHLIHALLLFIPVLYNIIATKYLFNLFLGFCSIYVALELELH